MARITNLADASLASHLGESVRATMPQFRFAFDDALELFGSGLLIEVRPGELDRQLAYRVPNGEQETDSSKHFLGGGDWQPLLQPIDNQRVATEIGQLLKAGLKFRATERYRLYHHAVTHGRINHFHHTDFDTVEKLDAYFEDLCRLIVTARRFGILARPEASLSVAEETYPASPVRPIWQELSERNIGVAIDATGRLVRIGPGKHRLAVARALDLTSVPCEVRMIHVERLRGYLERCSGDAVAAVRQCVEDAAALHRVEIAAVELDSTMESSRALAAALRSNPETAGRFVFSRHDVPAHIGRKLLVEIEAGDLQHSLKVPGDWFLGKGGWSGRMKPVKRTTALADAHGNHALSGAMLLFAAVHAKPYRIALAADGTMLAMDAERHGIPERGRVIAEVAMIHAALLRANRQADDASLWDAVLRCVSLIASKSFHSHSAQTDRSTSALTALDERLALQPPAAGVEIRSGKRLA